METQKHKVEKKAFDINRNIFMVISLITGISSIEIYKYCQVHFNYNNWTKKLNYVGNGQHYLQKRQFQFSR